VRGAVPADLVKDKHGTLTGKRDCELVATSFSPIMLVVE
jgi:hypothetical protein